MNDIAVQIMPDSERISRKGVGFGGFLSNGARIMVAICTLGLSNLFWKKNEGSYETKTKYKSVAVCRTCGHMWNV